MGYICLHDKQKIERFLRNDIYLHIYGIGDLDDFFWPYTVWYGLESRKELQAVALLYVGLSIPALLAFSREPGVMEELLLAVTPYLPNRFYAHLSPGLKEVLGDTHEIKAHGEHHKMALIDQSISAAVDCLEAKRLGMDDLREIQVLYRESYPRNWFDPRMLETGQYFGIRNDEQQLVSIAGIHVYSPRYKVAALGNIATSPAHRNRGFGSKVTARLCRSLMQTCDHIGLNVKTDNRSAISCYERLGFKTMATYGEFEIKRIT